MDYCYMANTGVRVSKLCLGTMTFGNEADEETAKAIMDKAYDTGINFLDTANVYNKGVTEEIVGRWIGKKRESVVLASKVYFPTGSGPNERGSSRRNIIRSVEKSLRRLQTEWLDLLFLHHWDPHTAIEESLSAMTTLVEQGKVLYPAVSNFSAWQTMKALGVARQGNLRPIIAIQPMYSLLKRQAEVEIFPLAESERLAVFPYNPLGAGLLTGKYLVGESGRLHESEMYKRRYADPEYVEVTKQFVSKSRETGVSPAALAVAWVSSHPAVTSTIIGARNLAQLEDTLGCLDIGLGTEERAAISALSPAPPLATDREA